jgi:hypothetical protein
MSVVGQASGKSANRDASRSRDSDANLDGFTSRSHALGPAFSGRSEQLETPEKWANFLIVGCRDLACIFLKS